MIPVEVGGAAVEDAGGATLEAEDGAELEGLYEDRFEKSDRTVRENKRTGIESNTHSF